jgi:hypothetical protein
MTLWHSLIGERIEVRGKEISIFIIRGASKGHECFIKSIVRELRGRYDGRTINGS